MANLPISSPPVFTSEIYQTKSEDLITAELENMIKGALLNNDVYLREWLKQVVSNLDNGSYPISWEKVTGKPMNYPTAWNNITGKPSAYPTTWNDITGKPTNYPTAWSGISGKPSSFPPESHSHNYLPLTGGNISGNLTVSGNITGNLVYNSVWGADYAEGFSYIGKRPEVGEIVEAAGKRCVAKADRNSYKAVGIVSNSYSVLAGCHIKEVRKRKKIAVGLMGQLPVKIIGKIYAGDMVICAGDGIGMAALKDVISGTVIGMALEDGEKEEVKMVHCLIRIR